MSAVLSVKHGMSSHPQMSLLIPEGEMKREGEEGGWRKEESIALNASRSDVDVVSITQKADGVAV